MPTYLIHYGVGGKGKRWTVQEWNGKLREDAVLTDVGNFARVHVNTGSELWAQENLIPGAKTGALLVVGTLTRQTCSGVRID